MSDYQPLDLSALCNASAEIIDDPKPLVGVQTLRGLPFQIGPTASSAKNCLLAFGAGFYERSVLIPVGAAPRTVVFAHRLLETKVPKNGPVGVMVAKYVFHFVDGQQVSVPIRERFEIAILLTTSRSGALSYVQQVAATPFVAVSDHSDYLFPRYEGRWELAGRRQMEVISGAPVGYHLWAWTNPRPSVPINFLQIVPRGPRFVVGGITLGHVDEHPFAHSNLETVKITLTQPSDAARPFNTEVDVDRGVATYPHALPKSTADQFLANPVKGWGEPLNESAGSAYVEIAATPSATVVVKQDGEEIGGFSWGELLERRTIDTSGRLRVEWIDRERNWVRTTVIDDETGRPVPCRIHFRSPAGVPYQPHGHHGHVNTNHTSWHMDVGGDVRLGQMTYAYIDGTCQGWLPRGEVLVDVARGFEYEPLRAKVEIRPGQQELTLRIRRWANLSAERWFSGDVHVHFLSAQGCHYEARAEDLRVVNLLMSQWGSLFTNSEEWTGNVSVAPDGQTIVYVSQENRQHMMGHLILAGLKQQVMPWCSDGPMEAELGGTMEVNLAHWADACRAQGGTVILPHFGFPNGETPALIATGRVDGVEMLWQAEYTHNEYYRYLNCGYRLPLTAGTDKMQSETPVGISRTYVYIPPEEEFSYDSWCRNLARGRTFISFGPILRFTVDGQAVGDTVRLKGNGGTVEVEARADSATPIFVVQVVQAGRVVAETGDPNGTRSLHLRTKLKIDANTWLAARVGGPGYWIAALRVPGSAEARAFAHTSPIYVACGGDWSMFDQSTAQYMLTMIDGCLAHIRESAWRYRPGTATHHHGEEDHEAYLERPFLEAQATIHRRIHQANIAY